VRPALLGAGPSAVGLEELWTKNGHLGKSLQVAARGVVDSLSSAWVASGRPCPQRRSDIRQYRHFTVVRRSQPRGPVVERPCRRLRDALPSLIEHDGDAPGFQLSAISDPLQGTMPRVPFPLEAIMAALCMADDGCFVL
jgi:hypothetical protein